MYAAECPLDGVTERIYRNEAYVYGECVRLAGQLNAIATGRNPADDRSLSFGLYDPSKVEG